MFHEVYNLRTITMFIFIKWALVPFNPPFLWNSKSYNKSFGTLQTGIFRIQLKILHKNTTLNLKKSKYFDRAKIKKLFVSRTRPTVRKHCDSKYYLGDLWPFFWGGYRKSWPEVPILFQNLRSELVYTFKWTKSVARLWRNQICEWTLKKKKKNPPIYQPIDEMWRVGCGKRTYF